MTAVLPPDIDERPVAPRRGPDVLEEEVARAAMRAAELHGSAAVLSNAIETSLAAWRGRFAAATIGLSPLRSRLEALCRETALAERDALWGPRALLFRAGIVALWLRLHRAWVLSMLLLCVALTTGFFFRDEILATARATMASMRSLLAFLGIGSGP